MIKSWLFLDVIWKQIYGISFPGKVDSDYYHLIKTKNISVPQIY